MSGLEGVKKIAICSVKKSWKRKVHKIGVRLTMLCGLQTAAPGKKQEVQLKESEIK